MYVKFLNAFSFSDWFLHLSNYKGGLGGPEGGGLGIGESYGLEYSDPGKNVFIEGENETDMGGVTPCPVCFKNVQSSYLSLHLKRVHTSLEVNCPLCLKVFKNKHSMGVHLARYHPRNTSRQHLSQFQNPLQRRQNFDASSSHKSPAHFPSQMTSISFKPPSSNFTHSVQQHWIENAIEDKGQGSHPGNILGIAND